MTNTMTLTDLSSDRALTLTIEGDSVEFVSNEKTPQRFSFDKYDIARMFGDIDSPFLSQNGYDLELQTGMGDDHFTISKDGKTLIEMRFLSSQSEGIAQWIEPHPW